MKRFFTSFGMLKLLVILTALVSSYTPSQAQKTAMQFVAGQSYNLDVVLDGAVAFPPVSNWPYIAPAVIDTPFSKSPSSLGPPLRYSILSTSTFAGGLPAAGGPLTSINTNFGAPPFSTSPVYDLAPTNLDNAMHLVGSGFDTFIFVNQTLIGDVYLLGAAGGENSSSATTTGPSGTATVTFLFTDNTTQAVTGVIFPNYRDTSIATGSNAAKTGLGRYNIQASSASVDGDAGRPRLFDIRVKLPYNLYGKRLRGIRVAKTSTATDHELNILGVCVDNNICLPTTLVRPPLTTPAPQYKITSTNLVSWAAVLTGAGYDVMLEAFPAQTTAFTATNMPIYPTAAAVNVKSTNSNIDTTFTPGMPGNTLIPNMVYVLFVRSKCSTPAGAASVWNAISFKTPDCATPTGITWETGAAATSRTTTALRLKWSRNSVFTTASPTHIQFEYVLNQDGTTIPTSGTLTTDTLFHFQNLKTCGIYWLWVRNNCTGNSWGPWAKASFQVACCPSAGNPDTLAGSVTPNSFTMKWPGTKDSALSSYQYQLVLNSPGTVDHNNWINTNDTFVHFPNANYPSVNAGQIYKFFVRSYCTDTASAALPPSRVFLVPFYPCDTPAYRPAVTNINMHGAQIDWGSGGTPSPDPILGYNVGLTINNVNPPANRATNQTLPINTHYITIKDTFYNPTNLQPNTNYCIHVRTECDSVYRNPSVSTVAPIYNPSSPWKTTCFKTSDTCVPPIIPTISNITATSMDAEWNLFYGILGYEYYIDQQPSDPSSPPSTWPLISFNKVMPTNLFSNTNYWFHLRTKCNATTYSPWTNTPFTTLALCTNQTPAPAIQASTGNPGPNSAIFTWPAIPNATAYDCAVTTSATPPAAPDATVSLTTYTAQGLTANTNYYFHLKANCSPNDATSWVSIPFKTDFNTSVSTLQNGVSVLVYPNPTNDDVTVDIQNNPKGTIQVLDMTGKVIYSTTTTDKKTIINMRPFASGVYMIKYFVDPSNMQMIRVQKI